MPKTSPTSTKSAPRDPDLHQRLLDYMARHAIQNSTRDHKILANRLNTNATYVGRYLNDDFRGDLPKFEAQLISWLDNEIAIAPTNGELITEAFLVRPVWSLLRHAKAHGHIAVGYSPAGYGKSCALRAFALADKTAIYIHVNHWSSNPPDIAAEIAAAAGVRGLNGHPGIKTITKALIEKLRNGQRLIILDNGQRMKETTRKWLADFWESVRCPIAIFGNPEILTQWQANDQHGSRVGVRRDLTVELAKEAAETAAHMLRLHFPAGLEDKEVMKEATTILSKFGAVRALEMRSKLARNIIEGGKVTAPSEAFRLAATQLITAA
jgi:DNA transposition AAA+ family ATPase